MMAASFTPDERRCCAQLVRLALEEDLGTAVRSDRLQAVPGPAEAGHYEPTAGPRDLTSEALLPASLEAAATIVARAEGTLAGLPAAQMVFAELDSQIDFRATAADADRVAPGNVVAELHGPARSLLAGERTALNFLTHLSGIATETARYVAAVAGCRAQIYDTRKTTPGWRLLEKYAVRAGGGRNHRAGLYDALLIKDNHLAALAEELGGADFPVCPREKHERKPAPRGQRLFALAVERARAAAPPGTLVEIEVDDLEQLEAALPAHPDIILLDNMPPKLLRTAVARRDAINPPVLLEASGGITLANVRAVAETGIDRISIGAITHSAPALDLSMEFR